MDTEFASDKSNTMKKKKTKTHLTQTPSKLLSLSGFECKGQRLLKVMFYAEVAVAKSWGPGG